MSRLDDSRAAPPRMKIWESFVRPLTSERRLSRASNIADEDIGSNIHLYFQRSLLTLPQNPDLPS